MLRFAVCDDQSVELKLLEKLLRQYASERSCLPIEIALYKSPADLLRQLRSGIQYDVFVLDMIMPEYSGVEVGHAIRNGGCDSAIIYITASPDFALDAISVHPEQYLLKPINPETLFRVLDDARKRMSSQKPEVTIRTREGVVLLPCSEIVCVEHAGRIMRVYTSHDREVESVCLRVPFEKLMEPVLRRPEFLQTHKSYLVNLQHIRSMQNGTIRTDTGMIIPISRRNSAQTKDRCVRYIQENQK